MIEINGSHGEGGGQIVRTAISLSAVTGKSCKISNIRSNRPDPGLKSQHLAGILAVGKLCGAKVSGGELHSTEVMFEPGKVKPGHLDIDVGTAGAVTLVLQSLLVPAVHANKNLEFEIKGGTHVKFAPTMDYFINTFTFFMNKMDVQIDTEIQDWGFYPKGGGRVRVLVKPGKLRPLELIERGESFGNTIFSIASKDLEKPQVAERQVKGAEKVLKFGNKETLYKKTFSTGSGVFCGALFENSVLGSDLIGERGMKAEVVGEKAAQGLKKQIESRACLDSHMADQILPYLALAEGESMVSVERVSGHCKTNISIIEKFLPVKFEISGNVIRVKGAGVC